MNELLKRLRAGTTGWPGDAACVGADTAEEAADKIERLLAALGSAKVALQNRKSHNAEKLAVAALADIAAALD